MMGDRKKTIESILGPKSGEGNVGGEKEGDGGDDALHAISQELIDAVHSKDPAAVAQAWRAGHDECASYGKIGQEPESDEA